VPYRLVGRAEGRIDAILLESAQEWGVEGAARCHRLNLAALIAVGNSPELRSSREVPRISSVRTYHLRSARRLVVPQYRVSRPRHLVLYRVALDGVVEILSLVHDRMLLARAANRAQREAGS